MFKIQCPSLNLTTRCRDLEPRTLTMSSESSHRLGREFSPRYLATVGRHVDIHPLSWLKHLMRVEHCAKIFPSDLDLAVDKIAQEKSAHDGTFKNIFGELARFSGASHVLRPDHNEHQFIRAHFGAAQVHRNRPKLRFNRAVVSRAHDPSLQSVGRPEKLSDEFVFGPHVHLV